MRLLIALLFCGTSHSSAARNSVRLQYVYFFLYQEGRFKSAQLAWLQEAVVIRTGIGPSTLWSRADLICLWCHQRQLALHNSRGQKVFNSLLKWQWLSKKKKIVIYVFSVISSLKRHLFSIPGRKFSVSVFLQMQT